MIERFEAQMRSMQMLSRAQEVTANNLANINTPGFKGSNLFFKLYNQNIDGVTTQTAVPMQLPNLSQGELELTGNTFDVAITGEGFFMVESDGRQLLTRDGRFGMSTDGYLINNDGAKVIGSSGPIQIPEYFQASDLYGNDATLVISKDGTIYINDQVHEKIALVDVKNPAMLKRMGDSYFVVENSNAIKEAESAELMHGYYENGNVNVLMETVDMMRNMQLFESQQKALATTDETLTSAINSLGRF